MIWNLLEHMSNLMTSAAVSVWTEAFSHLALPLKAFAVFILFVTLGMAFIECYWGFYMKKAGRFILALGLGIQIFFVLFTLMLGTQDLRMLVYVVSAGLCCALLNLFLPRVFLAFCGFILGAVAGGELAKLLPAIEEGSRSKTVMLLLFAIAGALFFFFFSQRLAGLLHGLTGGAVLGTVIGSMIPLESIPFLWNTLDMSHRVFRISVTAIFTITGVLAQTLQISAIRKRERMYGQESSLPYADADDRNGDNQNGDDNTKTDKQEDSRAVNENSSKMNNGNGADSIKAAAAKNGNLKKKTGTLNEEWIRPDKKESGSAEKDSIARFEEEMVLDAGEDLEEKSQKLATELTATVARAVAAARLSDRCEDVSEGLYSADIAASKLGISNGLFLEAMKLKGYSLPDSKMQTDEKEKNEGNEAGSQK